VTMEFKEKKNFLVNGTRATGYLGGKC
jgi:hypothetical protein